MAPACWQSGIFLLSIATNVHCFLERTTYLKAIILKYSWNNFLGHGFAIFRPIFNILEAIFYFISIGTVKQKNGEITYIEIRHITDT